MAPKGKVHKRFNVRFLQRKVRSMSNSNQKMIDRLQSSKQAAESAAYADGLNCGRKWAEEAAAWTELKRLSRVRDEHRLRNEWEGLFDGIGSPWSAGETLHHVIMGGDDVYGGPDRPESAEFWTVLGISPEQQSDSRFVLGFADGATESFASVEAQV